MLASLKSMRGSLFSRNKVETVSVESAPVTQASEADECEERSVDEQQICRVLYGTATRAQRSKKMAEQLHELVKGIFANMQVDLVRISDYNTACSAGKHKFGEEKALFVVVSTYGDGEPPDDSKSFFWWLKTEVDSGRKPLEGVPFAVFGNGNSKYPKFCQASVDMHDMLLCLGGTPLVPLGKGDKKKHLQETFQQWMQGLTAAVQMNPSLKQQV